MNGLQDDFIQNPASKEKPINCITPKKSLNLKNCGLFYF